VRGGVASRRLKVSNPAPYRCFLLIQRGTEEQELREKGGWEVEVEWAGSGIPKVTGIGSNRGK